MQFFTIRCEDKQKQVYVVTGIAANEKRNEDEAKLVKKEIHKNR